MGSPLISIVVNLFMEDFEARALRSSSNLLPPRIWLRFVDDTFIVYKAEHTQQFQSTLNTVTSTYNSQLRPETIMAHFPSWTCYSVKPQWNTNHHHLQKAHTYRSTPTLGQSSQHHQQIQNLQHTFTQGPICLLQPPVIGPRKPKHPYGTQQMQLP